MIQTFPNQLLSLQSKPLDATSQVDTMADLSDGSKIYPFVGKLVNVKEEGKTYVCSSVVNHVGEWSPVFNDAGTELYLKAPDGRIATLSVFDDSGILRLKIDYSQEVSDVG